MFDNHHGGLSLAAITTLSDEALIAFDTLTNRAGSLFSPTLRLGVTGLSRAGKTVFISSLVHNLLHGGRLPMFEAQRSGRLSRASLHHQPDDTVPRFQYEDHIAALLKERVWPSSTRSISELRIRIDYESASGWGRLFSAGSLTLDIVDYPGEWLLDLPLLGKSYAEFSRMAFELSQSPLRAKLAEDWHKTAATVAQDGEFSEPDAVTLHKAFSSYLKACKDDERALSMLPPGRFLMPGDLEGSPAITFAPLPETEGPTKAGSLRATMERRYEAYKSHIIKPFFREHITRLDRQIVLIDAMQAINAGPGAVDDLSRALAEILSCFRIGRNSIFTSLVSRNIDRILVAATKADHLHHESHDRLQAIVRHLVDDAIRKAGLAGAEVEALAMAAIRATKEGNVRHKGETLPVIIGTPIAGERINGKRFDGETETAVFPGDLPENPRAIFEHNAVSDSKHEELLRFVRFRPPVLEQGNDGQTLSLPHIRLDRAMEFLIGDWLA
jgi:predicted YcjX-like family ATPase